MHLRLKNTILLRIILLVLIITSVSVKVFSQSKQGDNWYFGKHAGVKFINGAASSASGGATSLPDNLEGTATISDSNGNLLFYTDGMSVWNKNHSVMSGGTGLLGHFSATQSGVIVPHPNSKDTFYIFTIDATQNNLNSGLRYTMIDMKLNSGLGGVVTTKKNVLLSPSGVKMAEKITAVRHCNNVDIWVIAHDYKVGASTAGNKFYAYQITPTGVKTTPVISTVGTVHQGGDNYGYGSSRGYLKASPDGRRLALAISYDGCGSVANATSCADSTGAFEIYDFNYTSGAVTNMIRLKNKYKGAYGVEFSPNGDILYGSTWASYSSPSNPEYNRVYQWNLNAGSTTAIKNSEKIIAQESTSGGSGNYGAIQLASNSKLYISRYNRNYVSVINYPNKLSTSCNYQTTGVSLTSGTSCGFGLPTFVQSYFNPNLGFSYLGNFEDMVTYFIIADSMRIDSVRWYFDDTCAGQPHTSTKFKPQYTYCDTGNYKVTLIIYKCSIVDTVHHTVVIHPRPRAKFTTDSIQCFKNHSFKFTNNSTIASGTINWHHWDFGDGDTSDLKEPVHVYSKPGKYKVKLIEVSDYGGYDSTTMEIYIKYSPNAEFYVDEYSRCLKGNSFLLDNTSTIGSTSSLTYKWYFGNGDSSVSISPDPISFLTSDSFNIKLIVKSDSNCWDTAIQKVYVRPMPIAGFYVNDSAQCLSGNSFIFTDTSSVKYGNFTNRWSFGNNDSTTTKNPTHTFNSSDTFNTRLIVTSNYGCRDTLIRKMIVFPMPDAQFSINDSTQCLKGNSFSFTNSSTLTSGTLSYLWYFGNGDTSSLKNPIKNYNTHDTFLVKLFANSKVGCSDSLFKKIYIFPSPKADFSINDTIQCLKENIFNFTNSTSLDWGSLTYNWNFGNGTYSTATNPSKVYAISDTLNVWLKATSNIGCNDSLKKQVIIHPSPVLISNMDNITLCENSITYINLSGAKYYNWSTRVGFISTSSDSDSVAVSPPSTTTYRIIGNNIYYCPDTVDVRVNVYPLPGVDAGLNDTICYGDAIQLKGTGLVVSWSPGQTLSDSTITKPIAKPLKTTKYYLTSTNPAHEVIVNGDFSSGNSGFTSGYTHTTNLYPEGTYYVATNPNTYHSSFAACGDHTNGTGKMMIINGSTTDNKIVWQQNINVTKYTSYAFSTWITSVVGSNPAQLRFAINGNQIGSTFSPSSTTCNWQQFYILWYSDTNTIATISIVNKNTVAGGNDFALDDISFAPICSNTDSVIIVVNPRPVSGFSINDSNQCLKGNVFNFSNLTSIDSGSMTFNWNFGDLSTSSSTNPSHSYTQDDTFTVRLIATSDKNCKDTITKKAYVFPNPISSFSINDSIQCFNQNNFSFSNNSSINTGSQTYKWYFGDGTTSTLTNPTRKYILDDTFSVKLVNTSNLGCKDSLTKTVYVNPSPITSFSINDSNQCFNGNNFTFNNLSSINSGYFVNFWTFGDGGTANSLHTSHSYTTDDTFNVQLLLISNKRCRDSLTKKVYIFPNPVSSFSINDSVQCFNENNFTFTNNSTINTGTQSYKWYFGDGVTSTTASPTRKYTWDDTFTVKLVNTSNLACTDSLTKTIYVHPSPETTFSINDSNQCYNNQNFVFTNSSTINSGHFANYWYFGDGDTALSYHTSHHYSTDDTFTVKLLLESGLGCKDSLSKKVYVFPNPVSSFSINDSVQCFNENNFTFTNNSTINTGTQSYKWYFGDGVTSTTASPTRKYTWDDTFTIKLVNTSNLACTDSLTKTIYVHPSPETTFSINDSNQCYNNQNFVFTNSSTINSGHFANYWYFGDGDTALSYHTSHHYSTDDTFTVKLLLESGLGCKDSLSKKVYVFPNPKAKFKVNDSTQCLKNNSFQFTNQSTINSGTVSYLWKFGDGQSSNTINPTHSYTFHDTFLVKLYVSSSLGCTDSTEMFVQVYPMPEAMFSVNDSSQCLRGNQFNFTNQTTIDWGTMSYLWHFGDGNTSVNKNESYSFNSDDTLTTSLVATSTFGCKDSFSRMSIIYPMPKAAFTINDSGQCLSGNQFVFTNQSTLKWGTYSIHYDFKDGYTSNAGNPVHSYLYVDTFYVKLKITSQTGCLDSVVHQAQTYYMPKSKISISDTSQCLRGNIFHYNNHSAISAGSMTHKWYFGNGNGSVYSDTQYVYPNPGTYTVKLITTSEKGCIDSAQQIVLVNPMPVAKYAIYDSSQCFEGNAFGFTNLSTIAWGTMSYLWDFGDNKTSTLTNPVHSYNFADTFLVKLIATSNKGCKDSISKITYVHVHPEPVAKFSINDTTQCLRSNLFQFTNNSTIASGSFTTHWDFGDGKLQNTINSQHTYLQHDTLDVKLLVISNWGCKDSILKKVYIYPMPKAKFSINDSSQCLLNNYYEFIDKSTIAWGSLSRVWNSGEPAYGTKDTFIVKYYKHDTFNVQLISNSHLGCYDTLIKKVFVHPMPESNFIINDARQCLTGNNFIFSDSTILSSGTYSNNWTFGDGGSANSINTTHAYSTYDTFTVRLISTSGLGCKDTAFKDIVVHPMPTAAFSINDTNQCLTGNKFTFTNNTSIPYGQLQFWWFFGDGQFSNLPNPECIYSVEDTNTVKLVVYSQNGCKDSILKKVYIYPNPVTEFSINDSVQCFKANSFAFTNQTTISSGINSYVWQFGNGNSSNAINPVYSYSADDTFNVTLTATSALGCSNSIAKRVYVFPTPVPVFSISNDRQCIVGNSFTFTNSSSINTGYNTYLWLFGDKDSSIIHSPVHSYKSDDTFFVKLLVTSDLLCKDSIEKPVYVYPNPVAAFSVNDSQQCLNGNNFTFTNKTLINSGSVSYIWNFDDGNSSTLLNPNHIYLNHDTFTVTLITNSNLACKDTIASKVYVFPSPKSSFSIVNDKQCFLDNNFIFNNLSSIANGTLKYLWSFGDGITSISKDPAHIYASHALYNIKLIAESGLGCKDSSTKSAEVFPMPVAQFSVNDSTQCLKGNNFIFNQMTVIPYGTLSYQWNFDDGNSSTLSAPTHSYSNFDTFSVRMISTSGNNCRDTVYHKNIVHPMPIAKWFANDTSQCLRGNLYKFTNFSTIPYGTMSYFWEFGDAVNSINKNSNHVYSAHGTYDVKLGVLSGNACYDSLIKQVFVRPMPAATFTVNDSTQCLTGNSFVFTNTSTVATGTISNNWSFGDGNTSTALSPIHTYSTYKPYTVRLITNSQSYNCSDTVYHQMEVYPMPVADFNFTLPCIGETVYFTDKSTVVAPESITSWLWNYKDGNTSILQHPQHIFTVPGDYMVKLLAGTNHQCYDSIERKVKVFPYVEPTVIDRATVVDDKEILLEWEAINIGRPKEFIIEKSTDKVNYYLLANHLPDVLKYTDDLVDVDKSSYAYRIKVLDSCNYISPYSNIGKTILLKSDTNSIMPVLFWTAYEQWLQGVNYYSLEAYNQKFKKWETVINKFPNDSFYEDTNTLFNQSQYCYRVVALRNGDNQTSVSNEICLPTPLRVFIPDAFTPNGDGLNDKFEIVGIYILEFNLVIFDRWGNKLFESNNLNEQWDGKYGGQAVLTGVYYYHTSIRGTQTQRKFITGTVTVIR